MQGTVTQDNMPREAFLSEMHDMNFTMKRKSGTVYNSQRPDDLESNKTFLDVPFCGSVCLVDDIEEVIISIVDGILPYNYKIEAYPASHY